MWKVFRRRKKGAPGMVGVWQRIGSAIDGRQRKAANYLNGKTGHWGKQQLRVLMVVCCIVFGGGAALVIWQAFHSAGVVPNVEAIRKPNHVLPKDAALSAEIGLSDGELQNIRAFRRHLDSLQQTIAGKRKYDSIARHRPGLLDSLQFIEKVYQRQLKTSDDGKTK